MATLNVSDKQKQRVVAVMALIKSSIGTEISQATAVDMGMALLEKEYGSK